MSSRKKDYDKGTPDFPDIGKVESQRPKKASYEGRVWTRNKALLIARYLEKFLFVTGGGQYIDLFSGPQHDDSREETWAAKLVLEQCRPDRLRRAYLFELKQSSVDRLFGLRAKHHTGWRLKSSRKVEVIPGDCNLMAPDYFAPGRIQLQQKLVVS